MKRLFLGLGLFGRLVFGLAVLVGAVLLRTNLGRGTAVL